MTDREDRRVWVTTLVEGTGELRDIQLELTRFPWDADEPLVILRAEHVAAVLHRFLAREVDAAWVHAWAETIEGRDDIDFEARAEEVLSDAIFELANPELHGGLDESKARELLDHLAL